MKKIVLLILSIFSVYLLEAQTYQGDASYGRSIDRYDIIKALHIPTFCGVPNLNGDNRLNKAAIAYDTCNSLFYVYNAKTRVWGSIGSTGGSGNNGFDSISINYNTTRYIFYKNGVATDSSITINNNIVPDSGAYHSMEQLNDSTILINNLNGRKDTIQVQGVGGMSGGVGGGAYIPLSGTVSGSPVTGEINMQSGGNTLVVTPYLNGGNPNPVINFINTNGVMSFTKIDSSFYTTVSNGSHSNRKTLLFNLPAKSSSDLTLTLPDTTGYLVTSVNGVMATRNGNVTIAAGDAYTASNGLSKIGNDIQLGGTLTKNDTLSIGSNKLFLNGSSNNMITINQTGNANAFLINSAGMSLNATTSGATTSAIQGASNGGYGVVGSSSSGSGVTGQSFFGGIGVSGISSDNYSFYGFNNSSTSTNSVGQGLHLVQGTSAGTAGNGLGSKITYEIQTNEGYGAVANELISKLTDVTGLTPTSEFSITGVNGGVTGNIIRIAGNGDTELYGTIKLKGYTVATLPTGTIGMTAYVTDASSPTFGATLVGGGSTVAKAFYNGTNWINE